SKPVFTTLTREIKPTIVIPLEDLTDHFVSGFGIDMQVFSPDGEEPSDVGLSDDPRGSINKERPDSCKSGAGISERLNIALMIEMQYLSIRGVQSIEAKALLDVGWSAEFDLVRVRETFIARRFLALPVTHSLNRAMSNFNPERGDVCYYRIAFAIEIIRYASFDLIYGHVSVLSHPERFD